MKLVSIIIPTYNSAAHLERCLQSVKEQTYENIEIIVVDRDSHDATIEIAQRYARVVQGGQERSSQFNLGASLARGDYFYRIDSDFELEPKVVEACVAAINAGADMVAIPNRSVGERYWQRVRQLERDAYLNDELIVAARFWCREAFEAVSGFDETLVACEDYDLHNRMIAAGYQFTRIAPGELHLGEPISLGEYARKAFYYGPSTWRYMRKFPRRAAKQMFPVRPAFIRNWRQLGRKPNLLLGLVILKIVQYLASGLAVLANCIGLLDDQGNWSSKTLTSLLLVWVAIGLLLDILPDFGVTLTPVRSVTLLFTGTLAWWWAGKRRAQFINVPLQEALPTAALAFIPFPVLWGLLNGIAAAYQVFTFSLALGMFAGMLVYLIDPSPGKARWGRVICIAILTAWVLFYCLYARQQIGAGLTSAAEWIIIDQALWATANGTAGQLFGSSILGKSLFSQLPAPALVLLIPFYWLGIGGIFTLKILQVIFFILGAGALYAWGERRIGPTAGVLWMLAYLTYPASLRILEGNFQLELLGAAALLWAILALESGRHVLFSLLLVLAIACGPATALAAAAVGVIELRYQKWYGLVLLISGILGAWVLSSVFLPYFGGDAGGILAGSVTSRNLAWIDEILWRLEVKEYLLIILAPLAFTPLIAGWWLLPGLILIMVNLFANQPSVTASLQAPINLFLFVAAIQGSRYLVKKLPRANSSGLKIAIGSLVLVSCLITARYLNSSQLNAIWVRIAQPTWRDASGVFSEIPAGASLAAPSSWAATQAHRDELYLLPEIKQADYLLVDLLNTNQDIPGESLTSLTQRAFQSPDYGVRAYQQGMILFERELVPMEAISRLVNVDPGTIDFPNRIEMGNQVAYLGFSKNQERCDDIPGFFITTYWQSLQVVDKPYLIFTAWPGGQQFSQALQGIYPVSEWQPGDVVGHEVFISLPKLPDGDDYEIVTGLWFDWGDPELRSANQLLGRDVIGIAELTVKDGICQVSPWRGGAQK